MNATKPEKIAHTPLGVAINERKRDCDLILGDVSKRDWKSVAQGMQYQIDAWTELKSDFLSATSHKELEINPRPIPSFARAEGRAQQ